MALALVLYALSEMFLAGSIQMPEAAYNWQTNILMVVVMAFAFNLGSVSARATETAKASSTAKSAHQAKRTAPEGRYQPKQAPQGVGYAWRQGSSCAGHGPGPRSPAGTGSPERGEDAGGKPSEASEIDAALSLFDQILEKRPEYDCNALSMYTRRRLFKLMAENLDEKRLRDDGLHLLEAFQTHGIMPANIAQNRVICAWRSKLPEHVLEHFVKMRESGVRLSSTAYRCIMAARERTDPEATLQLYDEMVSRGLKFDRVAFNAALCAFSHLGKTHQALQLFQAMPSHGLEPNGKTYGTLIRACTAASKINEALELLQTMQEQGFEPNRYAYHDAIHCCVKARRLGKAVTLYREMVKAHVPPCDSTLLHLGKACRKNGWDKVADEITEGMGRTKKPETPRDESEASTEFRDAGAEGESD